ncbi:MAG: hypothetical protein HGB26_01140 [Desulfobulbaceae bacterium]|nr:hypothetical protein [Desulfobulbaceae bacterium]
MKETWVYREDGSYVGFWDDEGGKIKTAEFRADVWTEGDIFTSNAGWNEFSHGYIFETADVCKFFNLATNLLAFTFFRKM